MAESRPRLGADLPSPPGDDGHLTVIGDLLEDIVVHHGGPITPGTDNPSSVHRTRGGSAANVAAAASGRVRTRFIGRVGDDSAGSSLVAGLQDLGVDVSVQRAGRTGTVVALVDETAERTMFPDRAAAAELAEVPSVWLAGTAVLHVPAYGLIGGSAPAVRGAIDQVRGTGGVVTLDVSAVSLVDALGPLAFHALIDEIRPGIVFANTDEARLLELDRTLPAPGSAWVIKDGARAAIVVAAAGEIARIEPAPVARVIDTTGAGDAFAGGFLAAWMTGSTLEDACAVGHQTAAPVLDVAGAGHGSPTVPSSDPQSGRP